MREAEAQDNPININPYVTVTSQGIGKWAESVPGEGHPGIYEPINDNDEKTLVRLIKLFYFYCHIAFFFCRYNLTHLICNF